MGRARRWIRCAVASAALAAAVASGIGEGVAPTPRLRASDGEAGDPFGYSIALDGETMLVGGSSGDGTRTAAYVFAREGGTWTQQAEVTPEDASNPEAFGASIALSGNTAIVGSPDEFVDASMVGAAHVFARAGTDWIQEAKLTPPPWPYGYFGYFGSAVSLDGDTAVVGAPNTYESSQLGAALVFVRTGADWTLQSMLATGDARQHDQFGGSVAVAGDTAMVGAPSGQAAYIFRRTGTTWIQEAKLTLPDTSSWFGWSVAFAGDTAVVGAPGALDGRGAAFVYTRSGSTWSQQATLTATNVNAFGGRLALSGDTIVVHSAVPGTGLLRDPQVHVFRRTGATWTQRTKLTAPDATSDSTWYRPSVALSGDTVVLRLNASQRQYEDAAYVFTLPPGLASPAGYIRPRRARVQLDARRPERSTLTASGTIDAGAAASAIAGPATFDVGGIHLDVPAFVASGNALVYGADGITLTIVPGPEGSSKAAFRVQAVGDLAGKVLPDGPLTFRFANASLDVSGTATLRAGAVARDGVTAPEFHVADAAATFRGGGRDSLRLTLGFATDGAVPACGEDLVIGFGDTYSSALPGRRFVRRGSGFVHVGRAPGVPTTVVDYARGTITFTGRNLDLGSFGEAGGEVTVTAILNGVVRSTRIRMARDGATLTY